MDLAVRCSIKAVKLNDSLAHYHHANKSVLRSAHQRPPKRTKKQPKMVTTYDIRNDKKPCPVSMVDVTSPKTSWTRADLEGGASSVNFKSWIRPWRSLEVASSVFRFLNRCHIWWVGSIDQFFKSQMHLSHIPAMWTCSKWCVVRYGTGVLWDLWKWSLVPKTVATYQGHIVSHSANLLVSKLH